MLRATPFLGSSRRFFSQALPKTPRPSRSARFLRTVGFTAGTVGTIYAVDSYYNASALTRTLRTLQTCAMITLDYKLNFTPEKSDLIPELHERVGERLYNLLIANGGLYIKIGQAIGANAGLLPKPIQAKFAKLFDDAPQIPYSSVLDVFKSEFGRVPAGPGGVFEIFEEQAIASASIAQVHKAKLWGEDTWVAVKVQKPDVGKQTEWDLGAYRMVMWMFENWAFDLPVYFVVDFVTSHLRQELDFVNEMNNARRTAKFVASEPTLCDKVYVPVVYEEFSTKKIMTAEFIDGVRLSDRPGIARLMGEKPIAASTGMILSPTETSFKPLQGGYKALMQTMVELFSAQMFNWGFLHCDPHPGNIIIRPNPSNPRKPQLVLLDHGLYVQYDDTFKKQWSTLWKGLMTGDFSVIQNATRTWGFGLPDAFASFTLMRAHVSKRNREGFRRDMEELARLSEYERSVKMKAKLKQFLTDTDRTPKVLIFITRNMRIVQGNNQAFGSPVNRVKITGFWASKSLAQDPNLPFSARLKEQWGYLQFRAVMFSSDVAFVITRIKQWIGSRFGRISLGFEDELENSMRAVAKNQFGMDIPQEALQG
ncbi:ABC1 family-domain-containing protein [Mycena floridula]|nr:ABC1 family-domain-containing protein [Mycena floridula]